MEKSPVVRLLWQGNETIASIPKFLTEANRIEITLPANYNHALFRVLNPDAADATPERMNLSGEPELLTVMAKVRGLEGLATLINTLRNARASVQILSPPKLVIIPLSDSSTPE
ncbi:MAG: hypothetical protein IT488_05440 [Gammaproteobacteria bacterium]|nr:hypothetical protein [Gammaproteobacteria bacterium]